MDKYTVSGLKTFRGTEGVGFNVNLLENGKKVAFVMDAAHGGDCDWQWLAEGAEARFEAYVASLPPRKVDPQYTSVLGETMPVGRDEVIENLVSDEEERRTLRRLCRKKTVFTLDDGKTYTLNVAFTDVVGAQLLQKYGHRLGKILNMEQGVAA